MKKAAYFLLALMIVLSCSESRDLTQFSSGGARAAAEYFYELLAKGQSQAYVDNMQEAFSMDTAKYSQFVDLMEQFLHEEKELRGGILSAKAERDTIVDTISMVYLNAHFGDSTREEIILPVVYTRGRWWIR
jgi:hypothetical protein